MPALDSTVDNLSNTTPAAPANSMNVEWQADPTSSDPRNISANVPFATATTPGLVPTPPNDATKYLDGTGNWSKPSGSGQTRTLTIVIDGGGATPSTGAKAPIQIPFGATITGWSAMLDQAGSFSMDLWFIAGSGAPPTAPNIPTSANKISASAPVSISSAQAAAGGASAISTWTTALSQWGTLQPNLVSVSGCNRITVEIYLAQT
jgi:hypothetical protein